jgi:hypothetical protein
MDAHGDLAFKFFSSIGSDFLERFGTWFFSDGYFRDKFFWFSTWVFHSEASLIQFNCTKFLIQFRTTQGHKCRTRILLILKDLFKKNVRDVPPKCP